MNDLSKVTRLELIDNTPCQNCKGNGLSPLGTPCVHCHMSGTKGRQLVFWDAYKEVELSLQDNGRTLKIFVNQRDDEKTKNN